MRVFIAGLATETNTFAAFPTGMSGFEEYGVIRDGSRSSTMPVCGPLAVFRRRAEAQGASVTESVSAFAQPAGRTVRAVHERLRDMILDDLRAAGEVDVVLLMLHGAMLAEGCDDCEGDLIARVREVAPAAVIGVLLDLHCHMTALMVRAADLVVACKEYPHVDFDDRAEELYILSQRVLSGEIRPVAALLDTAMIGFYPTLDPPMSDIVAAQRAIESKAGIVSVTIAHGFPWADTADVGTRVLVYADGDAALATREAERLARLLYDHRHALLPDYPDIAASLDRASGLDGRVVLGDFADNPGGGAPGDSTFFLRALIERRCQDAAIGCLWDPFVTQVCADAGPGATLSVRLGGKSGPASGDPVDLTATVMSVVEDHSQGVFGHRQILGRSVWLRSDGLDIAVCSIRSQVYAPDAFTGLGINLTSKRLIVVKSSNHYRAGFRPDADHLWHVRSPGAMSTDFSNIDYTRRAGDYFPRVPDPWAAQGAPKPLIFDPVRLGSAPEAIRFKTMTSP